MLKEYKVVFAAIGALLVVMLLSGNLTSNPQIKTYGVDVGVVKDEIIKKKAYYDLTYNEQSKDEKFIIPKGTVIENVYMEPSNQVIDNVTYTPAKDFIEIGENTSINNATTILLEPTFSYQIDFSSLNDDEVVQLNACEDYTCSLKLYDNHSNVIKVDASKNVRTIDFRFLKMSANAKDAEYYNKNGEELKKVATLTNDTKGIILSKQANSV